VNDYGIDHMNMYELERPNRWTADLAADDGVLADWFRRAGLDGAYGTADPDRLAGREVEWRVVAHGTLDGIVRAEIVTYRHEAAEYTFSLPLSDVERRHVTADMLAMLADHGVLDGRGCVTGGRWL